MMNNYQNLEFQETEFKLTKEIRFTANLAYFGTDPIIETKSVKLYYHSDKPIIVSRTGSAKDKWLYNLLITKGLSSNSTLELINYLNRLINNENLYEIYNKSMKFNDNKNELIKYVTGEKYAQNDIVETCERSVARSQNTTVNNKNDDLSNNLDSNKYIDSLFDSNGKPLMQKLNDVRNKNYPICYKSINDINCIPIWCYVHPSLAINQGKSIHLSHLAYFLEKIARSDQFPEFNNGAIMGLLNAFMKAKIDKSTVKDDLEYKYEQLSYELVKKNKRIGELEDENLSLREEIARLESLMYQSLDLQNEMKHELKCNNIKLDSQSKNIDNLLNNSSLMNQKMSKSNVANTSHEIHKPTLILYTSEKPDVIPKGNYKKEIPDNSIWIGSYCRVFKSEDEIKTELPEKANILIQMYVVGIDSVKFIIENNKSLIIDTFYRQILIDEANVIEFIENSIKLLNVSENDIIIKNYELIKRRITKHLEEKKINIEEEKRINNLIEIKEQIIKNGNYYIYFKARWRRIYSKLPNDELSKELDSKLPWIIRYGSNGSDQEILGSIVLKNSKYRSFIDERIKYEN